MITINKNKVLYDLFKQTEGKIIRKPEGKYFWKVKEVYMLNDTLKIKMSFLGKEYDTRLKSMNVVNLFDEWNVMSEEEYQKLKVAEEL